MKKSISICIFILISIASKAGWENPASLRLTPFTATVLQPAAVLDVKDVKYPDPYVAGWDNGMLNNNVVNKIVLGIDPNQGGSTYYTAYEIEAEIQIEAWDASGTAITPITATLELKYDPTIGAKEDLRTIYTLSGYHKVKVTVVDITNKATSLSFFPDHVYVENSIEVERFYTVSNNSTDPTSTFASGVTHNGTILNGEELEVSWSPLAASETPEAYELEWTFSQNDINTDPTSFDFVYDVDFKNNATNVVIKNTSYNIPLIYEKGLLVWRVRALYYDHSDLNTIKYTEWSTFDNLLINRPAGTSTLEDEGTNTIDFGYFISGFSPNKNWQYSIAFAEEGKNKATISYFDGTYRNRQSITRVNSDGNAIVGQTIYDFTGRPAIQVLPIPVVSDLSLSYRDAFNKSATSGTPAYNWKHFDVDATGNCTVSNTHSMATTSGASQYYASGSPGVTQLGGSRIPSAEGYPFVQTEYMPDNTGRVRRQGGVGLNHRLSGTDENSVNYNSHESEYLYGTPSGQAELDRLFGNEIGDYKHYKKNMVIDPNGQVSISYLDPQGRVVATALSGDETNTPNLDGISTSSEELFVEYENTEVDNNEYSLVSHRTILIEKEGLHTFYYKVAAPKYTDECMPVNYCFDCIYDLELTIKDECGGDLVIPENLKYMSGLLTAVNPPELNTTCSDSIILELRPESLGSSYEPLSINLPVGKYTIFKKLTVNRNALEYYKEQYVNNLNATCDKTLQDFIDEEKAKLDYTKCNYTCAQCYIDAAGDAEKEAQCDEFCKQKDKCYGLYLQLKQDMSLGGQYFDNIAQKFQNDLDAPVAVGGGIKPSDASFEYDAPNSSTRNDWLNRRAPHIDPSDPGYSSSIKGIFFSDFNTRFGVQYSDWDEIRNNWKPEYAEELVKLHPEHCYYEQCVLMQASYTYDQKLMTVSDGSEAVTLGYFDPIQIGAPYLNTTTYPTPVNAERDPFFFNGVHPTSEWSNMEGYLKAYDGGPSSVWSLVELNQSTPVGAATEAGDPAGGGCLSDYDWYYFRALYLAEKQKLYKTKYQTACNMDATITGTSESFNSLINDNWTGLPDATSKVRRFYLDAEDALASFGISTNETSYGFSNPSEKIEIRQQEFCKEQCVINADQWMADLKGCVFSSQDIGDLRAELIEICKLSCDDGSEDGASSNIPVVTINGNKTFEEAFEWIIARGGYSKTEVCNIQLVTFPKFEKSHKPAMTTLDSCACNKINLNATNYANLLSTSSLPAGVCSETELFTYTYDVEIEDLQLLKCLCANNLSRSGLAPTPPATDICYDEYKGHIDEECVTPKAIEINLFIEHLIANYDLDQTTVPTITNAKTSIPGFFGPNSLMYPNGNNLSCIPQISFGSLSFTTESVSPYRTIRSRNIIISDNCGFSCTLTVKLYETSNIPNFGAIQGYFNDRKLSSTSSQVNVRWQDAASDMEILTCFSDLACDFIYPQAFVPVEIACQKCLSCEELAIEYASFKQKHPYLLEPQGKAELVRRFTNYLNFDLGYHYTLPDIEDLFKQCTENTTCSTTAAAGVLNTVLNKMALNNDLGKHNVALTFAAYPEFYDPLVYNGSPSDNPIIKNNSPFYEGMHFPWMTETTFTSGNFTYIVTHPIDIIDGINYPVLVKIIVNNTTTENTILYIGDSLDGGETIIIPPLTAGSEYFVPISAIPYLISGTPNFTLLKLNATYIDDVLLGLINIPEGSTLSLYEPDLHKINTFTITDDNGYNCTIRFDMPDGLWAENIASIVSIHPDPYAIAGSNTMMAKVIMKGSSESIEIYIHSTCHLLTNCGTLTTGINKCPTIYDLRETDDCTERLDRLAESRAWLRYNEFLEDKKAEFERNYVAQCMQPFEKFGSTAILNPYQITLYYYDQADNLIKTVPPKGVDVLNQTEIDASLAHRADPVTNPNRTVPTHTLVTHYQYNTLNQLVLQRTPDAGVSQFWYDRLGRLVLSQNAKQINNSHYSYTRFDNLGRITEVGELTTVATINAENVADDTWLTSTINSAISTTTQITKTFYDDILLPAATVTGFEQTNLRKRVATTAYYENYNVDNLAFDNATHYAYDIVGNAHHVVQDNKELERFQQRFKNIHYNYDQISGNVNLVAYQPNELDQYYHFYKYDKDNRLEAVYTSRHADWNLLQKPDLPNIPESPDWVLDAKQLYYWHGPLVRTELGENKVQGTDYGYTIHGWLKVINSTFGTPWADGNQDGFNTTAFARDAFGFELGYYNGDYNPISGGTFNPIPYQAPGGSLNSQQTSLYNGNISYSVTSLPDSAQYKNNTILQQSPKASLYKYDQLNRLTQSLTLDFNAANTGGNSWLNGYGTIDDYSVMQISYDKNGNIQNLVRNAEGSNLAMDNFVYQYDANKPNQLNHVLDAVPSTNHYEDVDNQSINNYSYDNIGNLISDAAEEIATIEWNVYGKVKSITRTGPSLKPDLEFTYDAAGLRLSKKVIPKGSAKPTTTYYVHSASGNVMATYLLKDEASGSPTPYKETFSVKEFNIHCNGRIGAENVDLILVENDYFVTPDDGTYTFHSIVTTTTVTIELGNKNYELANHLGNVLATITDRKIPFNSGGLIDHHLPDIASVTDYYPFGMRIEKRSWSITTYSYGFNGMKKNDEIYGIGNEYTTEFRQLDVRLGRWLSIDPLFKELPSHSPYITFNNIPTFITDPSGLKGGPYKGKIDIDFGPSKQGNNARGDKKKGGPGDGYWIEAFWIYKVTEVSVQSVILNGEAVTKITMLHRKHAANSASYNEENQFVPNNEAGQLITDINIAIFIDGTGKIVRSSYMYKQEKLQPKDENGKVKSTYTQTSGEGNYDPKTGILNPCEPACFIGKQIFVGSMAQNVINSSIEYNKEKDIDFPRAIAESIFDEGNELFSIAGLMPYAPASATAYISSKIYSKFITPENLAKERVSLIYSTSTSIDHGYGIRYAKPKPQTTHTLDYLRNLPK